MHAVNEAIHQLLKRYTLVTRENYLNALKEIIQEIALLGLWRGKFFEHAAFYGGTALRILYGLDRFSDDLDFSLLESKPDFKLERYLPFVVTELESFGFSVSMKQKEKTFDTKIDSAFLKANTREHLLRVGANDKIAKGHKEEMLTVKFEVDTDPPLGFTTETQFLLEPSSFSVRTLVPEDLFAGKMHALLCRQWKKRIVKGRDWYDFVWYIKKNIPLNLIHLEQRMRQAGNFSGERLTERVLFDFLREKIDGLNIDAARNDVNVFLKSPHLTEVWSKEFFLSLVSKMKVIS